MRRGTSAIATCSNNREYWVINTEGFPGRQTVMASIRSARSVFSCKVGAANV